MAHKVKTCIQTLLDGWVSVESTYAHTWGQTLPARMGWGLGGNIKEQIHRHWEIFLNFRLKFNLYYILLICIHERDCDSRSSIRRWHSRSDQMPGGTNGVSGDILTLLFSDLAVSSFCSLGHEGRIFRQMLSLRKWLEFFQHRQS